jgi:hypothetical protein
MDERELRERMNEIHDFVTTEARERDKDAAERHREVIRAIEDTGKATVKAIETGFRLLADALRSR